MIDTFKYIANVVARDRETTCRETRRIRIKKWYKDNIGWVYPDSLFGEDEAERSVSWDESGDGGEEKDDTESGRKEKGKEIERMNSDNEVTNDDNDKEFYRPKSNDTPLDLLITLLDGSSSRDAPMDDSTDDFEEELDEDEDMDVYEIIVEDKKDSEAERVEGVGDRQIIM